MHQSTVVEAPAPDRPVVTHGLPPDIVSFTGREYELEQLLAAAAPGRVVNIYTVDGMPGIGKTALVTHAAHRLTERFPDGQFFHNLHAHTPGQTPADPVDVLAVLLTELGIDPRNLPATLEGRSALWRDRLTDKRALLVLDDAAGHAQIAPLLPSNPGCLTLVTSRARLIALDGAHPLSLDPLEPGAAADLFTRLAHRTPIGGEKDAVDEAVRLCGYLPLAITLLAGRLCHRRKWPIAEFTVEFAAAQDRLGEFDGSGDRAIYTAFTLSYQDLTSGQQLLFRRIGMHPGPDIDTYAAAALNNTSLPETRHSLEALFTHHLLEETAPNRYQPHDLLRAYARTLTADTDPADDRAQALARLLDYYLHTAQTADRRLRITPRHDPPPTPAPVASPPLATWADALRWMRIERANLFACLDAPAPDRATRSIHLTEAMASFLRREGPWPQAATLHQHAAGTAYHQRDRQSLANALHDLGVTRRLTDDYKEAYAVLQRARDLYQDLGDRLGQANALNELGVVRYLTDDYVEASAYLRRGRDLYQDLGDRLGQANALNELGAVCRLTCDYVQASDLQQRARDLYQDLGDRLGQANALNELGVVRYLMGTYTQASDLLQQARNLYWDIGDRLGQACTLNRLGVVRYLMGDYAEASDLLQQAQDLYQGLGSPLGQANTLNRLGVVRYLTGDYEGASALVEQALCLCREVGSRLGQASTLNELGVVRRLTGDYEEASDLLEQARGLYRSLGDRLGQANALHRLGVVRRLTGHHVEASDLLQRARTLYQDLGSPLGEAEVMNSLGTLLAECGKAREGRARHQRALQLARGIHNPLEEARALEGSARCLVRTGDRAAAVRELRQAVDIYRRIGAAGTSSAAEYLARL
ncbi:MULTISPECIES: tetratricopeptide repeat protein [Streptomyces]|uniref:tetratricopeptide repeat protein n=1 Tax=Streptomyces TaxID=1883 RepID=UPI00166FADF5|nr:tetratricopeptide repeat protein [Streptomyces ruber]